jgi:arylsulfatase A-like enzyme
MWFQNMNNYLQVLVGFGLLLLTSACGSTESKPNVVLIVIDDLNDYVTGIPDETRHPQTITPNIEELAQSGVAFRRAYSNNPVCAPSRSSFFTGLYPHTSGNLFWDDWAENPVQSNSKTLMEHFRDNGYNVAGSRKLMHHFHRKVWDEFKYRADYGPFVHDGENTLAHPSVPEPFSTIGLSTGPMVRWQMFRLRMTTTPISS